MSNRRQLISAVGLGAALGLAGTWGGGSPATAAPRNPQLGLTTGGGEVFLAGRRFAGIGVNYFDAFYRLLPAVGGAGTPIGGDISTVRAGLQHLKDLGIPFVRLMGCGYWPAENYLYRDDRAEYLRLFGQVVSVAEEVGVGLIPSLFWYSSTVPDLVDEPRNQWGNRHSRTHAYMRTYVKDIVSTFASSRAIWAWEFGNEYNLDADLPNAADWPPPVVPELGTRLSRDERDFLTHKDISVAVGEFARTVRRYDPRRLISSGHAAPRPSEWNQWKYLTWDQDSVTQCADVLAYSNPSPTNTFSMHLYDTVQERFGRSTTVDAFVAEAMVMARRAGKPLFVGEFGSNEGEGHEVAATKFHTLLDAIVTHRVPLSCLWAYDYSRQEGSFNITPGSARAYQLDAIAVANATLRG